MALAKNYNEFVTKIISTEMDALNSEEGQGYIKALLDESLKKNPNLTLAEWSKIKQEFILYLFEQVMSKNPSLMNEFMGYVNRKTENQSGEDGSQF